MNLTNLISITKKISSKLTRSSPQKIFESEKKVILPILEKIKIIEMLDNEIFKKSYNNFHKKKTKEVEFLNLYQSENCVLFCMFLPKDFYYQIHDHPEMMVFSKILEGEIKIENFSLKNNLFYTKKKIIGEKFKAKKNEEKIFVEDEINFLLPDYNNLHSLESETDSVVLDLVLNDYDRERPCSHFNICEFLGEEEVVLEFIGDLC